MQSPFGHLVLVFGMQRWFPYTTHKLDMFMKGGNRRCVLSPFGHLVLVFGMQRRFPYTTNKIDMFMKGWRRRRCIYTVCPRCRNSFCGSDHRVHLGMQNTSEVEGRAAVIRSSRLLVLVVPRFPCWVRFPHTITPLVRSEISFKFCKFTEKHKCFSIICSSCIYFT